MLNGKTFLAIIPARGGSKRLPRKNVLELAGKPLIAWTIDAALNSRFIDDVIVSTDDQEIADVAQQFDANIPFLRPADLGSDIATSFDVVMHAINFYHEHDRLFDFVVLLQPTSPLRTSEHIDEAILLLEDKSADGIISVAKVDHSPLWSNTLPVDGNMSEFIRDELKNKRSQDLQPYYRINGAIYIASIPELLEVKSFFLKKNVFSYEMGKSYSIDIDDRTDFYISELLMGKLGSTSINN